MSILYYILIIFGSAVAGFVLGISAFLIVTKFNDWRYKRRARKLNRNQLLIPDKEEFERGINNIDDGELTTDNEFREFEKLRSFAKGERGIESDSNSNADERRFSISNKSFKLTESDKQKFRIS